MVENNINRAKKGFKKPAIIIAIVVAIIAVLSFAGALLYKPIAKTGFFGEKIKNYELCGLEECYVDCAPHDGDYDIKKQQEECKRKIKEGYTPLEVLANIDSYIARGLS